MGGGCTTILRWRGTTLELVGAQSKIHIRVGQEARVGGTVENPRLGTRGRSSQMFDKISDIDKHPFYNILVEHTGLQGDSSEVNFVN